MRTIVGSIPTGPPPVATSFAWQWALAVMIAPAGTYAHALCLFITERCATPESPFGPWSPFGPTGPAGSWPFLKSTASRERFLTLALVTALRFSCEVPTEPLPRTSLPAAWPTGVAPRTATARAVNAATVVIFDLNIPCAPFGVIRAAPTGNVRLWRRRWPSWADSSRRRSYRGRACRRRGRPGSRRGRRRREL